MSERQADYLIKVLLASYMSMAIGYQVDAYLERGLARMMRYYAGSWGADGGQGQPNA